MDDWDYAVQAEERAWADLGRRIAAARDQQLRAPRSVCQDCGEPLEVHRLAYGICVTCQAEAERRAGWGV